jgi:hypothetical protein
MTSKDTDSHVKRIFTHSDHAATDAPSLIERRVSLSVVAVLMVIAGIIGWRQAQFDPARWRLQPAVETPVQPKPAGDAQAELAGESVAGLVPLTPSERFDAGNLSDKIDGKAELYLAAGFRGLETRRFALRENPAAWLERYVYDMGGYRNALAVFSAQRRPSGQPLALTPDAYVAANGVFVVHGGFYVEIIAADLSEGLRAGAVDLARTFVQTHAVRGEALGQAQLFPERDLVPDSVTLVAANAFGLDRLDWVFTAQYRRGQLSALGFVSKRKSAAEARELADAFTGYFVEYGAEAVSLPRLAGDARMMTIMDGFEAVATDGIYLFGVHEAGDADFAADVLLGIQARLTEVAGEP